MHAHDSPPLRARPAMPIEAPLVAERLGAVISRRAVTEMRARAANTARNIGAVNTPVFVL